MTAQNRENERSQPPIENEPSRDKKQVHITSGGNSINTHVEVDGVAVDDLVAVSWSCNTNGIAIAKLEIWDVSIDARGEVCEGDSGDGDDDARDRTAAIKALDGALHALMHGDPAACRTLEQAAAHARCGALAGPACLWGKQNERGRRLAELLEAAGFEVAAR